MQQIERSDKSKEENYYFWGLQHWCTKQGGKYNTVTLDRYGLKQILQRPTHIRGGLIDHCYVSESITSDCLKFKQKAVYYTDHDLITCMAMPSDDL